MKTLMPCFSMLADSRRRVLTLFLAALLSACGASGTAPDTVQITSDTPPPASDPSPSPGGGDSGADTTGPTVSITSPASGSVVAGTVTLRADAADPVVSGQTTSGIASVQLQVNGQNAGGLETGAPYTASFDTTSVADGEYQLRAIARDGTGNQTTSAAIVVTVRNTSTPPPPPPGGGTDTTKPTVTIESPTTSSTYNATSASLALAGKAADNTGVSQLTWSNNQGGSGSATLASGNWSTGNITLKANTSNVITVTARDAAGNTQTDTITVSYAAVNNTATLTWNANIEPDLAGYRVYYGSAPGTYNQTKGSGVVVTGTSHTVTGLTSGTRYYFALTAYDSSGNESDYSQEVLKDTP
jgi:hypothetical protein